MKLVHKDREENCTKKVESGEIEGFKKEEVENIKETLLIIIQNTSEKFLDKFEQLANEMKREKIENHLYYILGKLIIN